MDYNQRTRTSTHSQSPRRHSSSQQVGRSLSGVASRPTGYTVRHRPIRFNGRGGGAPGFLGRFSPRELLVMLAGILVLVILIVALANCARGCSSSAGGSTDQQAATTAAAQQNGVDSRVAYGISADVTRQLATALDRDDKIAQIAQNADQYPSEKMLLLALDEPGAVDFVAGYPSSSKSASPYTDSVTKGTAPLLYCWDSRWGGVDYGGSPLALTGSGPASLSMAYMGLTGKTDKTPADLATLSTSGGYATGDDGTSADFFSKDASGLGLTVETYSVSESNLTGALTGSSMAVVELKASTITNDAHWALATKANADGSVTLYDPTSTAASTHAWDAATIAGAANTILCVSVSSAS
ncbi:MAG: hypothetical protein WAY93_05050 [Atopobiaceae bacterium]|jgi:hypothetical protein|nr:hypothetical protein [Atopobiaceae bacterium]